jgi:hypothetical protein
MITREDLAQSQMLHSLHLDGSDYCQNHYTNNRWPRLTCIATYPRRRGSKIAFTKRFYVDGVEVSRCSELLERLNAPRLAVVDGGKAA